MTHSKVHIQRVHFEPEAPARIDFFLPNSHNEHGNLECEKGLFAVFDIKSSKISEAAIKSLPVHQLYTSIYSVDI